MFRFSSEYRCPLPPEPPEVEFTQLALDGGIAARWTQHRSPSPADYRCLSHHEPCSRGQDLRHR